MKCGQACPIEHLDRNWHPNPCEEPDGHDGPHLCSNWARHEWATPSTPTRGSAVSEHLFTLPSDSFAVTSDDCYTPRWVFDAMGLRFDLDVAAPHGGPWHVPAKRYYTAVDDGLTQPWEGLVWCNPPYSGLEVWADRWIAHPAGVLMGICASRQSWRSRVYAAADAVYLGQVEFAKPDGTTLKFGWTPIMVAFRGVGIEPAERLAAADPYGAVLYGRKAA